MIDSETTARPKPVFRPSSGNHPVRWACTPRGGPYLEIRMHGTVRVALLLFLLAGTGCTTTATTPATTPTSIAPVATAVPGTVATTTTSTTVATTSTTTTVDRLTEIAAIFEDLERRRLQAIFDQDEDAFRALYANDAYLQESLIVLDLVHVLDPLADFRQEPTAVIADSPTCIAAVLERDYDGVLTTGGKSSSTYVAELALGDWGLTWVGEGWACDGQHPLS